MAAITIAFDTVTKKGSVSADGTLISDLSEFHMYQRYDKPGEFYMEAVSRVEDEANKTYTSIRVCAAKDGSLVQVEPGEIKDKRVPDLSPELMKAVAARLAGKKS